MSVLIPYHSTFDMFSPSVIQDPCRISWHASVVILAYQTQQNRGSVEFGALPHCLQETITHVLELLCHLAWGPVKFLSNFLLRGSVQCCEGLAQVTVDHILDRVI